MNQVNIVLLICISTFTISETFAGNSRQKPSEAVPSTCNTFYRNMRRVGGFVYGQFQIPVDSQHPKMQLQVKFNRPIQSLTVRQTRARDISAHREFSIGSIEPENGVLTLTSAARTGGRSFFFRRIQTPAVTRIVYNGKTLCAANGESVANNNVPNGNGIQFDNEAIVVDVPISSSKLKKTNTTKVKWTNLFEDDEDEGTVTDTPKD